MFKRVADEPTAIGRGMAELEEALGSLRGRKFYGAFDESDEYRASVQFREGDDASALGLEVGTLPGGRYARVRLQGDPPGVYALIGPTFEKLAQRADRDAAAPIVDHEKKLSPMDDYEDDPEAGIFWGPKQPNGMMTRWSRPWFDWRNEQRVTVRKSEA
jgi:hypothetical protein